MLSIILKVPHLCSAIRWSNIFCQLERGIITFENYVYCGYFYEREHKCIMFSVVMCCTKQNISKNRPKYTIDPLQIPRVDKFISSIYIFYSGLKFKQQLPLLIMSWFLSNHFNYFVKRFSSNNNWKIIILIYILYSCIHISHKMLI